MLKHNENYSFQDDLQSRDPRPRSIKGQYWEENAPRKILDGSAEKLRAELLAEKRDTIADPDGVRPEDLDDQMDGEMSLFFEKS